MYCVVYDDHVNYSCLFNFLSDLDSYLTTLMTYTVITFIRELQLHAGLGYSKLFCRRYSSDLCLQSKKVCTVNLRSHHNG